MVEPVTVNLIPPPLPECMIVSVGRLCTKCAALVTLLPGGWEIHGAVCPGR